MAEFSIIPEKNVFPLPQNISLEVGALVEPIACAWSALSRSRFQQGWTALVIGAGKFSLDLQPPNLSALTVHPGPVGLSVILCLKAFGASVIVVSEVLRTRATTASQLGASHTVDPKSATIDDDIRSICGGVGPHVVVDCVGLQSTLDLATNTVRSRGTVVNMAFWSAKPAMDAHQFFLRQLTYIGANAYDLATFPVVIDAIATGMYDLASFQMISDPYCDLRENKTT